MKKDFVFFDFDGTLVNTSKGIFYSLNYTFEKMKLPVLTESQMRKYIGPPIEWSFMNFNALSKEKADEATAFFREAYSEKGVYMHELYDGVVNALDNLKQKGKIISIATSKPEMHANAIIDYYNLREYFTVISGATLDGTRSSKKDVLQHAIDLINVNNLDKSVLIGDTKNDVLGANLIGIDCIGVLYGFGTKEELLSAGAAVLAETPMEAAMLID